MTVIRAKVCCVKSWRWTSIRRGEARKEVCPDGEPLCWSNFTCYFPKSSWQRRDIVGVPSHFIDEERKAE